MPLVGWILPGDGVSVVWGNECYPGMGTADSMDLLHDSQDGVHMLDDMGGVDLIKEVVLDGVRDLVQIMDQIHLWQLNAIHADSARTLVSTATHIEDAFFHMRMDFNIGADHRPQPADRLKFQIPNPKSQTNSKSQIPNLT